MLVHLASGPATIGVEAAGEGEDGVVRLRGGDQRCLKRWQQAADDLTTLGADAMQLLAETLADCAAAGQSATTDPQTDAVTLWICLHGLAHQRAVSRMPWIEPSAADAIIDRIARLDSA